MFAALLVMLFALASLAVQAQAVPSQDSTQPVAPQRSPSDSGVLTFHVSTREVLLDLIALDRHDHPVLNLMPGNLQVRESILDSPDSHHRHTRRHERRMQPDETEPITSLRLLDPSSPQSPDNQTEAGFRVTASCLERATLHYQLAFHPGRIGSASGDHRIVIATTRPGVRLIYRHRYYVGITTPPAKVPVTNAKSVEKLLYEAACYYPETPLSIAVRAHLVDTGRTDVLRYAVAVDADSLSFLTLSVATESAAALGSDRRVQLDYGVCNFDAAGHPINFFEAPLDQVLTSVDYARALAHGFPHLLEFPMPPPIALTRFVVRDRATGNLGATDVLFPRPSETSPKTAATISALNQASLQALQQTTGADGASASRPCLAPLQGPIGSFGSIVPLPRAFCGDVYELASGSPTLPDFRELDPIGSLYTRSLDVPNQIFSNTAGIPGVTPRTNLFGIDYHGVFWIDTPGLYQFQMLSDDGALLQIDDKQLIDLNGLHQAQRGAGQIHLQSGLHTIHIPYYQGAITSVALQLWIRPAGAEDWTLFDLKDYPPPPAMTPETGNGSTLPEP